MLFISTRSTQELTGDYARRRAIKLTLWCVAFIIINILIFSNLTLWRFIEPLNGAAFYFAAVGVGLLLAAAPVLAVLTFCAAVWHAGSSIALPKQYATPRLDRTLAVILCVIWFSPALASLAFAGRSLASGVIRFPHPKREYVLATDPVAFWESIGFMLIATAVWAWLAWRYCQPHLLSAYRTNNTQK